MLKDPEISGQLKRRSGKVRRLVAIGATTALLSSAGALLAVSASQAASTTYASGLQRVENQTADSGPVSSITGGAGETSNFSADGGVLQMNIQTYRPAPGFQALYISSDGTEVDFGHPRVSNVNSQCWWSWPWNSADLGSFPVTCSYNS